MKNEVDYELLRASVFVAVFINLALPFIVTEIGVTPDQKKPPNGAEKLPLFDQLIHMLVHHAQVPLTSSLIVGVIIGLSIFLAHNYKEHVKKLI